MSAESLFAIVVPTARQASASKAVDAHGDSGFDRMLGQAMDVEAEQSRAADTSDALRTRTRTHASRPSSGPTTGSGSAAPPVDGAVVEIAVEATPEVTPPVTVKAAELPLPPLVGTDVKTSDDTLVPPTVSTEDGSDALQVLPGAPTVSVPPPVEISAKRSQAGNKGAAGPQVLPDPVDTGPAPKTTAATKGTDTPPVLPGPSVKAEGPQVLPGVVTAPVAVKSADRQVLPGTDTAAQTATLTEPAAQAVTAASAKAAATAMAALAPAVTPQPVRSPADRTGTVSNSVRATGEKASNPGSSLSTGLSATTVPATAAAAPSAIGTLTAPEATSLSDRPMTQGNAAPVPPVADAPDVAVKSTADQLPVEAPPAPVAQTSTASQTYSLSNLSNAAVEATAQMAAQIIRRMDARSTRFEMALTPDELGRVDVSLDIDEHGRLAARLAFDNPAAALDMKGRVDELRRQLEAAGFHLADDAFQFAERDRSSGEAFDRRQGRAFAAASRLSDETDAAAPVTAPRWMSLSLTPDRVDMKV